MRFLVYAINSANNNFNSLVPHILQIGSFSPRFGDPFGNPHPVVHLPPGITRFNQSGRTDPRNRLTDKNPPIAEREVGCADKTASFKEAYPLSISLINGQKLVL